MYEALSTLPHSAREHTGGNAWARKGRNMTDGTTVGTVGELWRYPVKSMGGERIDTTTIDGNGVAGDRGWVIREGADNRTARQLPRLLQCAARYLDAPTADRRSPHFEVTLPDDETIASSGDGFEQRLSEVLGREIAVLPLHPAEDLDHYRRPAADPPPDPMAAMREVFGLEEGDPFPDLGDIPMDILAQFQSPPGTYFDAFPIHILTTASLNSLASLGAGDDADVRRFRPNVLIDTGDAEGLLEVDWTGKKLRLGEVLIEMRTTTVRCSIPAHAQRNFASSRAVGRTLIEQTKQHLGSYCHVLESGSVSVGDQVELLD